MKTKNISCINPYPADLNLETAGIWEDAGFIPPRVYMHLVEFLHLTFSNEGRIPKSLLSEVTGILEEGECRSSGSYFIEDREKLYRFSKNLGIDIHNKDDEKLAAGITASVIGEYIQPFRHIPEMLKYPVSAKKEPAEEYYSMRA